MLDDYKSTENSFKEIMYFFVRCTFSFTFWVKLQWTIQWSVSNAVFMYNIYCHGISNFPFKILFNIECSNNIIPNSIINQMNKVPHYDILYAWGKYIKILNFLNLLITNFNHYWVEENKWLLLHCPWTYNGILNND